MPQSHAERDRTPRQQTPARRPWDRDYLHLREIDRSLRACRPLARGRLLDIGCGNRPWRAVLDGASSWIGVDVVREAGRPDVLVLAWQLPFAPASFDTVLCTQVLEHVEWPERLVAEAARVLRPGGHLILTAPQAFRAHEEPHDYFRYTRHGLARLAERAGLEPVRVDAHGGVWTNLATTLNNALAFGGVRGRAAQGAWLASNLVFGALDRFWRDEADAGNHLLVARRPGAAP